MEMEGGDREGERGVKYYYKLTLILAFKHNQCVKSISNLLKVS